MPLNPPQFSCHFIQLIYALVRALLITALCSLPLSAHADEAALIDQSANATTGDQAYINALLLQAKAAQLDKKPSWRLLLHMPKSGGSSQVISPEFFLSETGRLDAWNELEANLSAFFAPFQDAKSHARCRFPARQMWLARELNLPELMTPDRRCVRIWQWMNIDRLSSASVALVSGYFGNPASAFGHALLRFDTGHGVSSGGLTDLSVNFGALVPENENMLLYVMRGLTGGYVAGFSDKDFIEHDQVYVRGENRDMWNYQLPIDAWSLQLLAMHVWEISGKKFTYFFLNRNCAWRLAEILELVMPVDLRHGSDETWYVPVELFNRIERAQSSGKIANQSIRFQPSAQRTLVARLTQLTIMERDVFDTLIRTEDIRMDTMRDRLNEVETLRVLDTLMDWVNWKNPTGSQTGNFAHIEKIKQKILLTRLSLPVGSSNLSAATTIASPGKGTPPMRLAAGMFKTIDGSSGISLQWTAVSFGLNGFHGVDSGELEVADLRLSIVPKAQTRIEEITALSVRKLNVQASELPNETDYSWQFKIGARRDAITDALRPNVSAGIGQALQWTSLGLQAYGFLDAQLLAQPAAFGLSPNAGLLWKKDDWRARLEWRKMQAGTRQSAQRLQAAMERQMSANDVISLALERNGLSRLSISWQHFQ